MMNRFFANRRQRQSNGAQQSTSSSSSLPMSSSSIAQQQVIDPSTTKALGTLDKYSDFELTSWASSPTIPDSGFACEDFRVGAGMLVIQPSTGKVVLCYDTKRKKYFLPKGRKDIGESLAQAAVREACEEVRSSGFFFHLRLIHIAVGISSPTFSNLQDPSATSTTRQGEPQSRARHRTLLR